MWGFISENRQSWLSKASYTLWLYAILLEHHPLAFHASQSLYLLLFSWSRYILRGVSFPGLFSSLWGNEHSASFFLILITSFFSMWQVSLRHLSLCSSVRLSNSQYPETEPLLCSHKFFLHLRRNCPAYSAIRDWYPTIQQYSFNSVIILLFFI